MRYIPLLLALLALLPLGTAFPRRPLSLPSSTDECGGHLCSGFTWYPVTTGTPPNISPVTFSAKFNVPGLPNLIDITDPDFCHYIYFNVFFPNSLPPGGIYNQFVPQLMLGDALSSSSGPPHYNSSWGNFSTWVFSAQYFFALNTTEYPAPSYHAATGTIFPASVGEVLWTRMDYDTASLSWRLSMGVEGDASRTSVVDVPKPYMGLLDPAASWGDEAYSMVHVNSCWELYGIQEPGNWPSSGSNYVMEVSVAQPGAIPWNPDWSNGHALDCPGEPTNVTWREAHNGTVQQVFWGVQWAPPPTPCLPTCMCTDTTYDCRGRNLTAFPQDMFRGWPELESILLLGNKVTSIPVDLFQGLTSLAALDIGYNNVTSLPAGLFQGLSSLTTLGLSGLPLSAPFDVTSLGMLPALTSLSLGGSTLQGGGGVCPDFTPLATLAPRLATLFASYSGLSRFPPRSFSGLNLTSLDLSHSPVGVLTSGMFDGLQCGEIKLAWSKISVIEADAFTGLTANNIDLYFNLVTVDSIPSGGLSLPNVANLCLAGNPLDSRVFSKPLFSSAPHLVGLDLMGGMGLGPFLQVLPPRAFASAPSLVTLQLFNSGITAFSPGTFEGLPNLINLNIGFCLAVSSIPKGLFDPLPTLQTLVVNNGGLAGDNALSADAFAHNPALSLLDLSWQTPGISSLPSGLLAGCDQLSTIDLTFQSAGILHLSPGTFAGINKSGTLRSPVSITLVQNNMKDYGGLTTDAEITAAICAEAHTSPAANCTVAWSPQTQSSEEA